VLLECIRPFGNFVPGDEVEVPAGAVFDTFYFKVASPAKESKKEAKAE